ncbi:MAG: ATP synthase F1 subunit gamma [Clostridia bacterium]|nr:ATP synthase F1 subunit gamma [Clostridia bacterium]
MAGGSMKDIKLRIKSIQGTRQITKAMQLVASSKLRRAKERMELSVPYSKAFNDIIDKLSASADRGDSIFFTGREVKKVCHCVIAGDRGLAGGYNSNVFKEVMRHFSEHNYETKIFPIGRKTLEYFKKRFEFIDESYATAADISIGNCFKIGSMLTEMYVNGEFDELFLTYTHYKNVLHQEPLTVRIFPLPESDSEKRTQIECEPAFASTVKAVMPSYVASVIYTAVAQSYASELTSRQNAMDTATSNADEMLSELQLQYNRARQAGITQEITEIVAGANS